MRSAPGVADRKSSRCIHRKHKHAEGSPRLQPVPTPGQDLGVSPNFAQISSGKEGFATIRAEAHLRHNRLGRVRQAFRGALRELAGPQPSPLPRAFAYDEGADPAQAVPPQERLHFRLWDRRSFVVAHADRYRPDAVASACRTRRRSPFSDARNTVWLEFLRAEPLTSDAPPDGLWFEALLRRGLLHGAPGMDSTDMAADVTDYYSQPTGTMVADGADRYLARLAAHVQVGEALSDEELHAVIERTHQRAGPLGDEAVGAGRRRADAGPERSVLRSKRPPGGPLTDGHREDPIGPGRAGSPARQRPVGGRGRRHHRRKAPGGACSRPSLTPRSS